MDSWRKALFRPVLHVATRAGAGFWPRRRQLTRSGGPGEPPGDRQLIARRAVTYGSTPAAGLAWTPAARERVGRIPSFVRGVVMKRVEDFARTRGLDTVTPELLSEIRRAMPIDVSRRRPFFLDED